MRQQNNDIKSKIKSSTINRKMMPSSSARIPQRHLNTLQTITICAITVALLSGSFVTTAFAAPAKLDPIAVAVPNDSTDDATSSIGAAPNIANTGATAISTTTVDVENAELVELTPQQTTNNGLNSLPAYIAELNDPDIGGPVEYMPIEDGSSLKVIAWDLLPPVEQDPQISSNENNLPKTVTDTTEVPTTQNTKLTSTTKPPTNSRENMSGIRSEETSSIIPLTNSNRGNVYYTSSTVTTSRPTTVRVTKPTMSSRTTRVATTTSTRHPTTTTTRRTTTTARPTTTTSTTPIPLNPDDFFRLEHGDSYTLPSWLADIDDPELDAAVTYIVPEDINEYNDTISRDLLPPFEPYTDLNNIDLPAPKGGHITTTTTNRPRTTITMPASKFSITTTTSAITARPPTVSTSRPHWIRAQPTNPATTITKSTARPISFDDRFSSNHIAQAHNPNIASSSTNQNSKVITSFLNTTTTTTQKPRLTTSAHNFNSFNQNLPNINKTPITSAAVANSQSDTKFKISNSNPFLPSPFKSINDNKFTTTTTAATTTSTSTSTPIEENPFNSATLPPWLADFDYTDLAPGVPFIYNEENSESDVFNDLLPPSQQIDPQTTNTPKPVFITSFPTSFNSFQNSLNSDNRHDSTLTSVSTSTARNFAFNNFPSKVTTTTAKPFNIHNSFAQEPNNNSDNDNNNQEDSVTTSPPFPFEQPTTTGNDVSNLNSQTDNKNFNTFNQQQPQLQTAESADQIITEIPSSSSFNNNFAAPFDTTTTSDNDDTAISTDPEFGSSTKTTFTKSNGGKVITNNIFGTSSSVTTPTKQFGFTASASPEQTAQKGFQQSATNNFLSSSTALSGSSATFNKPSTPSGFSTFTSTQQTTSFGGFNNKGITNPAANVGTGKYTGGFGGAPGVLGNGKIGYAVQADGTIRSPNNGQSAVPTAATLEPKLPSNPSFENRIGVAPSVGINKFQGTFGGPPGVLIPFDNVKSG